MKTFKIVSGIIIFVVIGAASAATGLTIWANKPRGIKIDISKLSSDY